METDGKTVELYVLLKRIVSKGCRASLRRIDDEICMDVKSPHGKRMILHIPQEEEFDCNVVNSCLRRLNIN